MAKQAENAELWGKTFLDTPLEATTFDKEEPLQKSMLDFAEQMGIPTEGNALTDNLTRWGRTLSSYIHLKCGEEAPQKADHNEAERFLGSAPALKMQKLAKPKGGDIRELILPGGGDLCLRVWAGLRRMICALAGWYRNKSTNTPAYKDTLRMIEGLKKRKAFRSARLENARRSRSY